MKKFASEKVMALIDGQLDPAELPELVQEMIVNPNLVKDGQSYLATSQARLSQPFEAITRYPIPAEWSATIMQAPLRTSARPRRNLFDYVQDVAGRLRDKYAVPGWSLAAGPVLAGLV